jgi:hypothetical protein
MLSKDKDPVHQVCHTDHSEEPNKLLAENLALVGKTMPGTLIVPLEDWRSIYFTFPTNITKIMLGRYQYFPGNCPHGGMTNHISEGWHPALHLHLDSRFHPRVLKDFLNLAHHESTPTEHIFLVTDMVALRGIIEGTTFRMQKAIEACGELEGAEYDTGMEYLKKKMAEVASTLLSIEKPNPTVKKAIATAASRKKSQKRKGGP